MPNFVEALGRSQAVTSAISGIQGIQQGELAIQNSKMQQAINEHTFKKMKAEEEAANRLIPVDPILNQLTPSVKKFWQETGQSYFQKGASGGNYVRQKDLATIQGLMKDENFNIQSDKLFLEDLTTQEQEIQNKIKQMSQPDEEGKAPKVDEKMAQTLQQQLADIQKKKMTVDQSLDAFGRRKKEREDFALSQGETRFSGTGEQIATGGVKPTDLPAGLDEFEAVSGIDPKLRGTAEYKKAYIKFLQEKDKATTKPVMTELNPYQKFSAGHQLRSEIKTNPYIKGYQEVSTKYSVMQKALKESQTSKNLIAVDQALITLFNKMTDPESVVRESEYARTPQDMAMYNRIQGKIDKLRSGGAGLTSEERNALVRMGQNFMEIYQSSYDQTISDYKELAKQSGLDPKVIGIPYERKNKQTQVKDKLKQKYGLE